jgi:group I intron endonuclease
MEHQALSNSKSSRTLNRAVAKYGIENFTAEHVASAWSLDSLRELEVALVRQYGTLAPIGYNLTAGGCQNLVVSEVTRSKMSSVRIGMKFSPSHVATMSAVRMGVGHTDATRAKMSVTRTGGKHTEEWKQKQRISAIRRGISAETRAKINATRNSAEYRSRHGANKEKSAARRAAYYAANKDRIAARNAARYVANKAKITERNTAWRAANKEKVAAIRAAYKAKIRAARRNNGMSEGQRT